MDKSELAKVERYLRRTFANHAVRVEPRPKKADSAEVYIGEEFIGVLFLDDEEGDRSYSFQMTILDTDHEEEYDLRLISSGWLAWAISGSLSRD